MSAALGEKVTGPLVAPAGYDLAKQIIRRQMNQAGNILLCAVEALEDDEFFAGGASGISPAWTVGHLGCVTDLFTSWIAGEEPLITRGAHQIFNSLQIGKKRGAGSTTKADTVSREEFPKGDVLLLFRQAQVRGLALLDDFDGSLWESPTPRSVPETLPTWGAIWQALGVHTYWHLGELSGSVSRYHETYTLNTVVHYFYTRPEARTESATNLRSPRPMT